MPTLHSLLQGHTPLIFASIGGHVKLVQMLLSHEADPLPSNGHVSPALPKHRDADCATYQAVSVDTLIHVQKYSF